MAKRLTIPVCDSARTFAERAFLVRSAAEEKSIRNAAQLLGLGPITETRISPGTRLFSGRIEGKMETHFELRTIRELGNKGARYAEGLAVRDTYEEQSAGEDSSIRLVTVA